MTKTTTIHPTVLSGRGLEITIAEGTPGEVAREAIAHLTACLSLIPPWVQFIELRFDADQNRADAELRSQSEYRRCTIALAGHWLRHDDRYRRQIICHEISHMWLVGMHDAFYEVLSNAIPSRNEPARRLAESMFDHHEEQTAESLGWLMQTLLAIKEHTA